MKLFLANSVFTRDSFDLMATVDAAAEHSFDGVQLFLNESHLHRLQDLGEIAERALQSGLDIIAHLPDRNPEDLSTAIDSLLRYQRERRSIVHFSPNGKVPELAQVALGLENAVDGYDEDYYRRLFKTIVSRGLFLAFDVPRLFSMPPEDINMVRDFAKETLSKLTARDVIHLVDLMSCNGSRSNWCPLREGIMGAFLPIIAKFEGLIVLEFEDVGQALQSKRNLMHYVN